MCKISSWQEAAVCSTGSSASVLCDDADGWDGGWGRREAQEGGDICILRADSHCHKQQKPTQHCKAVILQLKINFKNKLRKFKKRNNSCPNCEVHCLNF